VALDQFLSALQCTVQRQLSTVTADEPGSTATTSATIAAAGAAEMLCNGGHS